MACGWGGGGNVGVFSLTTGCLTGTGWAGGGGGGVGLGGSMICDSISTGTMTSMARWISPCCKAHSAATWNNTTLPAMTTLRLKAGAADRGGGAGMKSLDDVARPKVHAACWRSGAPRRTAWRSYLRKIHQADPTTKIRLAPMVKTYSMLCSP